MLLTRKALGMAVVLLLFTNFCLLWLLQFGSAWNGKCSVVHHVNEDNNPIDTTSAAPYPATTSAPSSSPPPSLPPPPHPPPPVKLDPALVAAYVAKTWPSMLAKSEARRTPPGWSGLVLSSFPRSGSHWLRTVMELYYEQPMHTRTFITSSKSPYLLRHTHDAGSWPATLHLYREPVNVAFSECEYRHGENPKNFCVEDCLEDVAQRHAQHTIAMTGDGPRKGQLDVNHADLTKDFCATLERIDAFLQSHPQVTLDKMKGVLFDHERCQMAKAFVTKDELERRVNDPNAIPASEKESYENRRKRFKKLFTNRVRHTYVDEWIKHAKKNNMTLLKLAEEARPLRDTQEAMKATQAALVKVPPTPLKPLSGCKAEGRRIFDSTLFGNEFDLIEARIYEYHEVVDGWIFLDHDVTFTGQKRPQLLRPFLEEHVPQFMDRIIIAEGPSRKVCPIAKTRTRSQAFACEIACRDALLKAVPGGLGDNDYLLISDTDEIANREYLQLLRGCNVPTSVTFLLSTYHYSLHWHAWKRPTHARACNGKFFKSGNGVEQCFRCKGGPCPRIHKAPNNEGWHMSYFGGGQFIRNKLGMYAETQTNKAPYNTMDYIMGHSWSGHELLERSIFDLKYIPDDQLNGPWFVLANKDQRHVFLDYSKEDRPHAWRG